MVKLNSSVFRTITVSVFSVSTSKILTVISHKIITSFHQEQCARVLLFRGASKTIQNYNNQTAHQVAIVAGNMALAEIIKLHDDKDVGKW